jgi:MFS family permease
VVTDVADATTAGRGADGRRKADDLSRYDRRPPRVEAAAVTRDRVHVGRHRLSREYRGILLAQFTSECGDQIGAIAVSLLVYSRSGSPFLAAASYAVTYVPIILASVFLAPLVDRLPRRAVMIGCDLGRSALMGLLVLLASIKDVPIPALLAVVLLASFLSPPFSAARTALVPDIFGTGPRYMRAMAKGRILQQVDVVLGFALGGLIVAAVSPRGALLVDTGSFALSALLTFGSVRPRPAAIPGPLPTIGSIVADLRPGLHTVLALPVRRALLLLGTLSVMFLIAPEALAVAYSRQHGGGAVGAGVLSAAQPAGVALGAWLMVKFIPMRTQLRLLLPMAGFCAILLAATELMSSLPVSTLPVTVVLWAVSGLPMCFVVTTVGVYNSVTTPDLRGRAIGVAMAGIAITQGLGFLLWGAVGSWQDAAAGVTWAGVFGIAIVGLLWSKWPHREMGSLAASDGELG